jgi:hypothetical protein
MVKEKEYAHMSSVGAVGLRAAAMGLHRVAHNGVVMLHRRQQRLRILCLLAVIAERLR